MKKILIGLSLAAVLAVGFHYFGCGNCTKSCAKTATSK